MAMQGTLYRGWQQGLSVSWTLGKIIFPVTLIITVLQHTPVLPWLVQLVSPLMGLIGLPGEAAVPLVIGNTLNLYAAIGAIVSFDFSVKEVFILAIMLSFSHNLFIENTLAAKVGVSWWLVTAIRVGLALLAAALVHLIWNGGGEPAQFGLISQQAADVSGWGQIVLLALKKALLAVAQIACIVIPLMIAMQFFRDLGLLKLFADKSAPFARFLGMEKNASATLVSGLAIGLAFGAGLMMQAVKEDGVSKRDIHLVMIFLVACHAVVEDTLIFIPLGIPVWPLLLIRLGTAVLLTVAVSRIWNRHEIKKRKEAVHEHSYGSF